MYPPIEKFYDRATAAALVRAAAAAYGGEGEIEGWAAAQGCGGCEIVADAGTDTLAFVAEGEGFVVVCFRGTMDLRNWITDLDCRRVVAEGGGCGMGMVHEGFYRALDSVWGRLVEALGRTGGNGTNRTYRTYGTDGAVFFAGHSLGGALAMLAAARWTNGLGEAGAEPRGGAWVYTFGQPRVGDGVWARWYDGQLMGRTFRVVHADDVVARVPWLLQAYRHCGTEVFYPTGMPVWCHGSSIHNSIDGGCPLGRPDAAARRPYLENPRTIYERSLHDTTLGSPAPIVNPPWWVKVGSDAAGCYLEWRQGKIALLADHHVDTYVKLLRELPMGSDDTNGKPGQLPENIQALPTGAGQNSPNYDLGNPSLRLSPRRRGEREELTSQAPQERRPTAVAVSRCALSNPTNS